MKPKDEGAKASQAAESKSKMSEGGKPGATDGKEGGAEHHPSEATEEAPKVASKSGKEGGHSEQGEERNECICKQGWTGETMMVECDGVCKNWYHPPCISMTKCENNIIDRNHNDIVWLCRSCVVSHPSNALLEKAQLAFSLE